MSTNKCIGKTCKDDQICRPSTGRCVKKDGPTGRQAFAELEAMKVPSPIVEKIIKNQPLVSPVSSDFDKLTKSQKERIRDMCSGKPREGNTLANIKAELEGYGITNINGKSLSNKTLTKQLICSSIIESLKSSEQKPEEVISEKVEVSKEPEVKAKKLESVDELTDEYVRNMFSEKNAELDCAKPSKFPLVAIIQRYWSQSEENKGKAVPKRKKSEWCAWLSEKAKSMQKELHMKTSKARKCAQESELWKDQSLEQIKQDIACPSNKVCDISSRKCSAEAELIKKNITLTDGSSLALYSKEKEDIDKLGKMLSKRFGKKRVVLKPAVESCGNYSEDATPDEIRDSLKCSSGKVCDVDLKQCREVSEGINHIIIDGIPIQGTDEAITKLKNKLASVSSVAAEIVQNAAQLSASVTAAAVQAQVIADVLPEGKNSANAASIAAQKANEEASMAAQLATEAAASSSVELLNKAKEHLDKVEEKAEEGKEEAINVITNIPQMRPHIKDYPKNLPLPSESEEERALSKSLMENLRNVKAKSRTASIIVNSITNAALNAADKTQEAIQNISNVIVQLQCARQEKCPSMTPSDLQQMSAQASTAAVAASSAASVAETISDIGNAVSGASTSKVKTSTEKISESARSISNTANQVSASAKAVSVIAKSAVNDPKILKQISLKNPATILNQASVSVSKASSSISSSAEKVVELIAPEFSLDTLRAKLTELKQSVNLPAAVFAGTMASIQDRIRACAAL